MKNLTSVFCAIAMLLGASAAMADNTSGTVKTIDAPAKIFTLDNDTMFLASDKLDLKKLKVGEKVEVTYEVKRGLNEAQSIKRLN